MADDRYSWVSDSLRCKVAVAGCITVVTGSSAEEVLLAFGGNPAQPTRPWTDAMQYQEPTVALLTAGAAVVAVEDNGFQGSRTEVARAASRRGRSASCYWNVNMHMRVSLAASGRELCAFDPTAPRQRSGDDPSAVAPLLADLDFATGAWVTQGMLLVERFTEVVVTPELISGFDRVHALVPVLDDQRRVIAEHHSLRLVEPDLCAAVAALPATRQRQLAESAATVAVMSTGLDAHPAIADAIGAFGLSPPMGAGPALEEAVRQVIADGGRIHDYGPWVHSASGVASYREMGPQTRRAQASAGAAKAVRAATNPDPLAAALDAVANARIVLLQDDPDWFDRIWQRLA